MPYEVFTSSYAILGQRRMLCLHLQDSLCTGINNQIFRAGLIVLRSSGSPDHTLQCNGCDFCPVALVLLALQ